MLAVFALAGCGGSDDGGGSVIMSSVGQSGHDLAASPAPAGAAYQAPGASAKDSGRVAVPNDEKNTIFLSKTSDEIFFVSAPAVYDLSQITVTAPNPAGKPIDRTEYPHTEWTVVSGLGTLSGVVYSSPAPETAVLRAVYRHGGGTGTADFVLRVVGLASITLGKAGDEMLLAPLNPGAYDLSAITVTAVYSNGVSKDVTKDPASVWSLVSGAGTLAGSSYTVAAPETAVFKMTYTLGGISASAEFKLSVYGLSSILLGKTSDRAVLTAAGPALYDLSAITVTAVYSNGVSKDVTNDAGASWSIVSGPGAINGRVYSTSAAPGTAVLAAAYSEAGAVKQASFELAVDDRIAPSVILSDDHPDAVIFNGDFVVITATFSENHAMAETPAPAITIGGIVVNAPMAKVDNLRWTYVWSVQTSALGPQQVTIAAFDASGNACAPATGKTTYDIQSSAAKAYSYVMQWTGITYTCGVAVDQAGNVYATSQDHSVRKFSPAGPLIKKWGSYGTANGQFYYPGGISIGPGGEVYVADEYNSRIQKFDSNGNFLLKWGSYGAANGQFNRQFDVAADRAGYVYVVDRMNHRVQKFDSNGNFILKFGGYGSGDGRFNQPLGVRVDAAGNIFVADSFNHRVQKFDPNGNFLLKWGSYGMGDSQFNLPASLAIDSNGNVLVTDHYNSRIQKFDSNGVYILQFGTIGSGDGQLRWPYGIDTDRSGNLYISDFNNHRVVKFAPVY